MCPNIPNWPDSDPYQRPPQPFLKTGQCGNVTWISGRVMCLEVDPRPLKAKGPKIIRVMLAVCTHRDLSMGKQNHEKNNTCLELQAMAHVSS